MNIKNKIFGELVKIRDIFSDYSVRSYSQEGEDLVLARFFGNKKNGFYVDIGANHPKKYSNTYYFYKKGWFGINIDPLPESKKLFDKYRKRDINLNIGISNESGKMKYYMFEESQLNTFSEKVKNERKKNVKKIVSEIDIKLEKLSFILDKYVKNKKIDFFSIDTEGFDFNVLKSNDWEKYRPKVIIVELFTESSNKLFKDKVFLFLKSKNYDYFAKTGNSVFFKRVD
ncbi:MAG: FkbM family methyltransferase [Candidatus ainarchaeum sp.]|nr:FkbM family methyltransferase [Candidatus ainarchaeum sp.]